MNDPEMGWRANLGTRRIPPLPPARFPDASSLVSTLTSASRPASAVDVLLVNPPSPDGGIWIRSQHRVGRRSRENMIWPQVSLAQLAALLMPDYTVEVVDCIATRMGWPEFEALLEQKRPKYYLTQVTAPTLRNDLRGVFTAKALGAATLAFGTHVTPLTLETSCSIRSKAARQPTRRSCACLRQPVMPTHRSWRGCCEIARPRTILLPRRGRGMRWRKFAGWLSATAARS